MGPLCAKFVGWLATLRFSFVLLELALTTFCISRPGHAFAEEAVSNPAPEDSGPLEMSRDQWRERIAEAKRRAREVGSNGVGMRFSSRLRPPTKNDWLRSACSMMTASNQGTSFRQTRACSFSRDVPIRSAASAILFRCRLDRSSRRKNATQDVWQKRNDQCS
jgi:hypothetical protein